MKKQYLKAKIILKKEDNRITVVASDETLDRHGDVLPIESWDLSKFKTAPRMLVDHDHLVEKIVGRWKNVRIEGKQLLMDAEFHDITELSRAVKQMVEEGYLNTVSVGFIYNGPEKDGDRPTFELIETSWVTVPANPSARVQASLKSLLEKNITDEEKEKITSFAGEMKADEEDPEKEDDEDKDKEPEIDPATGEPKVEPELDEDEEEDELIDDDILCLECGKKADAPKEMQSPEYPICNECLAKGWEVLCELRKERGLKVSVLEFIKMLANDSEKLKTLTKAVKSAELLKLSLKEAAHFVNKALMDINKGAN